MHNGLDIAAPKGNRVIAPALGIVTDVRYDLDLGRMVAIDHGYGRVTRFGHMSRQAVRVGQQVTRGQVVGYVGSTGQSTGPHVHYEIRINGIPVDPTRYIVN